jgi:magnesium transporter
MTNFASVASNLGTVTKGALNGALHPLRSVRMAGRLVHRSGQKPGAPPGSLVHSGPQKVEKVRLRLFEYDADRLQERTLEDVSEAFAIRDNPPVGWVNVDGLHDTDILGQIRDSFGIHLLVMEDVLTLGQRAKMEEYEGYLFFVLPMLTFDEDTLTVHAEQLSLVLGPSWVLTFQERFGDVFEPVRERLRNGHGRIRQRGSDYLAYALIDAVVDRYFGILEKLGDVAEDLEEAVMEDPAPEVLHRINHLKKELLLLRRSIWPLREALSAFARTESELVAEGTQIFVRDVYDHAIQVIDTVETLRDLTGGMTDLYLSSVGQRTNEVMKVLTIMASIFIPLTFMAGIYGMNFDVMPELHVPWAYPVLWLVMLAVAGAMVWYFRKKKWF